MKDPFGQHPILMLIIGFLFAVFVIAMAMGLWNKWHRSKQAELSDKEEDLLDE